MCFYKRWHDKRKKFLVFYTLKDKELICDYFTIIFWVMLLPLASVCFMRMTPC